MLVLSFTVAVFIKHAIINRHTTNAVRPQQSYQIDAFDHFFLLAGPMPIDQSVKRRIRFLECRIIEYQNAPIQIDLRFGLTPEYFRVGFKAQQEAGKSIMRGSVSALRLTQ